MNLTADEKQVLVHTLTGGTGRVYRNHFVAIDGHDDMPVLNSLRDKGLMTSRRSNLFPSQVFHATEEGAKAIGYSLEGLK